MGYSTCGGCSGREAHGRTCDHCDTCRVCDRAALLTHLELGERDRGDVRPAALIKRVTVSGYGLAGYSCPEHVAGARQWARDSSTAHGFAEAFR